MIRVKKRKENKNMEKQSQIIKDLKLKIPTAPSPVGSYQAFKISNKLAGFGIKSESTISNISSKSLSIPIL